MAGSTKTFCMLEAALLALTCNDKITILFTKLQWQQLWKNI